MNNPIQPALGDPLPASHPSEDLLEMLRLRRSTTANMMTGPGPSPEELERIIHIGTRVPDHRRVVPFRFLIFDGAARQVFGDVLARIYQENNPAAEEALVDVERNRFSRAPVVVAVISSVNPEHKTPEWEQVLSAGAVCQNMLLAASASGYAAQWLTEWYAFDAQVHEAIGLTAHERVAGFIYLGTAQEDPKERPRPDPSALISRWEHPAGE